MKVRTSFSAHSGPNMTPLVDVVMVILIFLMLARGFGGSEHFLAYHAQPPLTAVPMNRASVAPLDPRIQIFIQGGNGPFAATIDQHAVASSEELRQELVALRQKLQSNGVSPEKIAVVLTPSRSAEYQHVIAAYQAAAAAELTRVAFQEAGK